jgi:CxxC motif-containing protein (DUF1111 family)
MKMKSRTFVFKAAGINRPVLLGFALLSTSLMLLIGFDLEVRAQSPATIPVFTGMGDPLPGVAHNPADLAIFSNGQLNFKEVETLNSANAASGPAGQLGPLFNNVSCAACHDHPAEGGGALFLREIRVRNRGNGAPPVELYAVDNMLRVAPQTQGSQTIFPFGDQAPILGGQISSLNNIPSTCQRQLMTASTYNPRLPVCDTTSAGFAKGGNCVSERESLPLMGDGLVEATADSTFEEIAANQPAEVRGTVRIVTELDQIGKPATEVSPATLAALSRPHVGRFGWKSQNATLIGTASDAYVAEIGISNDLSSLPNSTCALKVKQFGVTLQFADDPEDSVDETGRADIDRFTDFMRGLQPPPQIQRNSMAVAGALLFAQTGCQFCHVPTLTTASNPVTFVAPTINGTPISASLNRTLANVTYHPYSDFLLHDMGALGDGISDGIAGPTMMRTATLWGLRSREVFLHDGRATDITSAIVLHAGQGQAAAEAFQSLSATQQQELIAFLMTL